VNRPIDLARLRARDKATVARALDRADDARPGAEEALQALFAELARAGPGGTGARIGVTGPPGVGKSTLVAAIARAYRQRDLSVGVLAIDPSSVRSGGALLGDRVRIAPDVPDPGLFVRSLATRGEAGGLARTVPAAARILGAVYERTLIETVGVGQNETDVRDVVDTVILVIQPGSGDALQFLKAGIMEVPDVLVVNKADQDELARRAESELKMALHALASANMSTAPSVLRTSAQTGQGVDELVRILETRGRDLAERRQLGPLRRAQHVRLEERRFLRLYGERGLSAVGGAGRLRTWIADAFDRPDVARSPFPRLSIREEPGA
jgi:LAO/AO transport system kinase